jgi:hypothetical protein
MRQYILMLTLLALPAITAMEKNNSITLVGSDGGEFEISRDIAEKIPFVEHALQSGMQEAQQKKISFKRFDVATLQDAVDFIKAEASIYKNAPVLKNVPMFFEQTKQHPAYTPADIPQQTRQILEKQLGKKHLQQLLNNNNRQEKLEEVTSFLGLDGVKSILDNLEGKSIADTLQSAQPAKIKAARTFDVTQQRYKGSTLSFDKAGLTSLVGMRLTDNAERKNCETLNLNNNAIERIELNILNADVFPNLQNLYLVNNKISIIAPGSFYTFENLERLDLGGNQIKSILAGTFYTLENLKSLSLRNNSINTIEQNAFDGLEDLQSLDLSGNNLDEISKKEVQTSLPNTKIRF